MNFAGLNLVVVCQLPEPYGPPDSSSDCLIDTASVWFVRLQANLNFRLGTIQLPADTAHPRMTARTRATHQAIGGHEKVRAQTGIENLLQQADYGKLRSSIGAGLRVNMRWGSQLMNLKTLIRRKRFRRSM
jgi:hypothetical protein